MCIRDRYNPKSEIEFDLAYAQSLLDDAGWVDTDGDGIREKNGVKASTTLLYSAGDDVRQAIAMAVSNQILENLGIEMTVEGVGWQDLPARMYSEPLILAWGSSNPKTSYMPVSYTHLDVYKRQLRTSRYIIASAAARAGA